MTSEFKIHTYKDLLKLNIEETNSIPKLIFRTSHYKAHELPADIVSLYKREFKNNPEYKLFYFDDDDCKKLINDSENQDLILAYDTLNAGAYKADIVRYLLLYKYGGVYMDFSMGSFDSIDNIIKDYKLILTLDFKESLSGIYNAFMATKKDNLLFNNVINRCVTNIKNREYFNNVWELTGPVALRKEFNAIYNIKELKRGEFDKETYIYELVSIHGVINNLNYIIDEKGNIVIKTRLYNHYDLLYKEGQARYPELHYQKNLYKSKIKTYDDFKKYKIDDNKDNIPKLIFRTGSEKANALPKSIIDLYHKTLLDNEGYEMFYFDDSDRLEFIKDNYDERYVNAYKKIIPKAFQADFFRYLILFKFGGIYMDFSMSALIPIKDLISSYKNVYVRDRLNIHTIYNAFIATIADSCILKSCIEKCLCNIENEKYGYDTLCVTGPVALAESFIDVKVEGFIVDNKIKTGEINKDLFIYSFEHGDDEYFKNPYTKDFVVKNKIENHYEILYKNKYDIIRYDALWNKKMVFKDDLFLNIENKFKIEYNKDIDLNLALIIYEKCKEGHQLDFSITRTVNINNLYLTYLNRDADIEGLTSYFISSRNIEGIKNDIINSNEYKSIKNS